MNEVNYDIEKARKLVNLLSLHFKDSEFSSLATVETPVALEVKSNEWIYYIFYSCLLDYGMNSKLYHERLVKTYREYPHIFDPVKANNCDDAYLLNIIKTSIRARYPNTALKKWQKLSKKLIEYPNIRLHIENCKNLEEMEDFIDSTDSYGQKTGNLLLRLLIETKLCQFDDLPKTIPLDRHDLEICSLTKITKTRISTSKEIDSLAGFLVETGNSEGVNSILLDKYLWEIGNKYCNNKLCKSCPLCSLCKGKDEES